MHYYRIYDDHEELNFFKSTFSDTEIEKFLKEFECQRKQYFNLDFVECTFEKVQLFMIVINAVVMQRV